MSDALRWVQEKRDIAELARTSWPAGERAIILHHLWMLEAALKRWNGNKSEARDE